MRRFKQWGIIIVMLPFLFLFQNCGSEAQLESMASTESNQIRESLHKLGISQLTLPSENLDHPELDININIYESTVTSKSGVDYCPGFSFFHSLQEIINEAQLCSDDKKEDSTDVCSFDYQIPSAILETHDGAKIRLGAKDQNCKKVEMCSPSKEDFELLIKKFIEIKESLKCS